MQFGKDAALRLLIVDDSVEAAEAVVSGLRNSGIAVRPSRPEAEDQLAGLIANQSPDLAVGVFIGYDRPRSLGDSAQAATYAAPIFRDFMQVALKDKPDVPFRVPPGIKLVSVDPRTGMRSSGQGTILEAFKPGTAPPESFAGGGGAVSAGSADADRAVGSGTGGLY